MSEAQALIMQPNVKVLNLVNKMKNQKSPDKTESHIDEEELDLYIPKIISKED